MNCHKFLLSRCQIPKKLLFYVTSRTTKFSHKNNDTFIRCISSNPNIKSDDGTNIKASQDARPKRIPKPNLRQLDPECFVEKKEKHTSNLNPVEGGTDDINHFKAKKVNKFEGKPNVLQKALKDTMYNRQELNLDIAHHIFCNLSKMRLSSFVVVTAAAGYFLSPGPLVMTPLLACLVGTGLVSAAANTLNQIIEVPYDSQMTRTKDRALVKGHLSPESATTFAGVCSTLGLSILWFGANPLVCTLGAANMILYAFIYTPLKRVTIANTWVGAIVGSMAPLMGWAACSGSLEPNAFFLAAFLYAWQFPHFNALSWNYKADYARAGYRMTCLSNEGLCRRAALRYSLLMIPLCTASSYMDFTTWLFAMESLPFNGFLIFLGFNFYWKKDIKSARRLFLYSLLHLPVIMALMVVCKNYENIEKSKIL